MVWLSNNLSKMNCPNCKNPIQDNYTECEWCGGKINPSKNNKKIEDSIVLTFKLKKTKGYGEHEVLRLFINNYFIERFILKDGIDYTFTIEDEKPLFEYEWEGYTRRYKMFDKKFVLGKKYLIEFESSFLGVEFDNPRITMTK
jgi:hypothetical protein